MQQGGDNLAAGWKLLESYLLKYDSNQTNYEYHSIVLDRIYSTNHGINPPKWLTKSIKKLDPSSLIRIYLKHSFLEEAMEVLNDFYLWKLSKESTELFSKNVSIPIMSVDILLKRAEEKKGASEEFKALRNSLKINLGNYINSNSK
jgi:hypothetical protein